MKNFIWKAINRRKIYHTYNDRHEAVCFQCRVRIVVSARRSAAYHRIRMSGFGRQLRFESFRMHAGLAEVVPWTVSGLDSGMPTYPKEFQQRAHAPPGACVCLRKGADVVRMMPENRVIIAGSGEFTDQNRLNKVCRWIFKTARIPVSGTTIISGTYRGTDKMGEEYAKEEGMAVARFPADWSRYGKMAEPRRNGEMARYAMKKGCNGVLIAFLRADSRGTKNMIDTALKMKLETYVVKYEEKIIEKYNYTKGGFEKIFG